MHKSQEFGVPLVQKRGHNWLDYLPPDTLNKVADNTLPQVDDAQLDELAERLYNFGLKDWEILVLLNKDVMGMTYGEINDAHGFTGVGAVYKIYKIAKEKAKLGYLRVMKNA